MAKYLFPTVLACYLLAASSSATAESYAVKHGDTLARIAQKAHVPAAEIQRCNEGTPLRKLRAGQKIAIAEDYTIQKGDSLWNISQQQNVALAEIIQYNPRYAKNDTIYPGEKLRLPCREEKERYAVKKGDTLEDIAQQLGASLGELYHANPKLKSHPDRIYPGDIIYVDEEIEEAETSPVPQKKREKEKIHAKVRSVAFPGKIKLEAVYDSELIGKGKEFYDPHQTGNPLLRVRKNDLARKVSPHFTVADFAHVQLPGLLPDAYEQSFGGDAYYKYIRLDPELVEKLEGLRKKNRKPFDIRSGYRSYGYNERLYRKMYHKKPTASRHSSGQAADITAGYSGIRRFVEALFSSGGIGKGARSTHVDVRGKRARWAYTKF